MMLSNDHSAEVEDSESGAELRRLAFEQGAEWGFPGLMHEEFVVEAGAPGWEQYVAEENPVLLLRVLMLPYGKRLAAQRRWNRTQRDGEMRSRGR